MDDWLYWYNSHCYSMLRFIGYHHIYYTIKSKRDKRKKSYGSRRCFVNQVIIKNVHQDNYYRNCISDSDNNFTWHKTAPGAKTAHRSQCSIIYSGYYYDYIIVVGYY